MKTINESRAAVMRRHIEAQSISGLTVRDYCTQNGIVKSNYYYWHRKLSEREAAGFTPIHVGRGSFIEVTYPKCLNVGSNATETQFLNMGMKLIYSLRLLLIIAIIGVIVFIISKRRKSKIGIYISVFLFLVVIASLMTNYIDEWMISKKDVISDLKNVNIELRNNFKITNNNVSGMPERIQKTTIEISSENKARIIEQITTAKNYKAFLMNQDISDDAEAASLRFSKEIYNIQYSEFYSI